MRAGEIVTLLVVAALMVLGGVLVAHAQAWDHQTLIVEDLYLPDNQLRYRYLFETEEERERRWKAWGLYRAAEWRKENKCQTLMTDPPQTVCEGAVGPMSPEEAHRQAEQWRRENQAAYEKVVCESTTPPGWCPVKVIPSCWPHGCDSNGDPIYKLTEVEALRIEALKFESLYLEQLAEFKRRELREVINKAAQRSGVDPATHRPDVGAKRWIRVDEKKP